MIKDNNAGWQRASNKYLRTHRYKNIEFITIFLNKTITNFFINSQ